MSQTEVKTALQDLLELSVQLYPSRPLLPRAFEIALTYQQSAHDCLYVALAERGEVELWTGDERLFNALSVHFPFIRFIGTYTPKQRDRP